jgi:hypothetical protein
VSRGQQLLRVRLADGSLDLVTVGRAIALLREGGGEPEGWSADDGRAVLAEVERRATKNESELADLGQLPGRGARWESGDGSRLRPGRRPW